jgi:SAM-dependent methyltransferase
MRSVSEHTMLRSLNSYLLSKLTESQQRRLQRLRRPAWMGSLRRMRPLSEDWGIERGTPIDRYYIERFLGDNREVIRGKVLEIRDSRYTTRFGNGVCTVEVLDVAADNPKATIVADLAAADIVPAETFDCIILTQTLQYIFDHHAAVLHLHRMLRPAGTLLATVPALSRMYPRAPQTDFWRYTVPSLRALLTERFGPQRVSVTSFGNLLSGLAFMAGMAAEELRTRELEHHDLDFPLVIAARAIKTATDQLIL